MTILAAYISAGKPNVGVNPLGSFEGWPGLVRNAVIWAGLSDPCATRRALEESADVTKDAIADVLRLWFNWTKEPVTASDRVQWLWPPRREEISLNPQLRSALETLCNLPPGKTPAAKDLSYRFRTIRRRPVGNSYLDATPKGEPGVKWTVKEAKP